MPITAATYAIILGSAVVGVTTDLDTTGFTLGTALGLGLSWWDLRRERLRAEKRTD